MKDFKFTYQIGEGVDNVIIPSDCIVKAIQEFDEFFEAPKDQPEKKVDLLGIEIL